MKKYQQTVNVQLFGLESLLGTTFIALKLMGYINWPWIWVLCPFWINLALILALVALALAVAVAWGLVAATATLLDSFISWLKAND